VDTTLALVSEEHQEALAPIMLTILSYARDGAALSEDLAACAGEAENDEKGGWMALVLATAVIVRPKVGRHNHNHTHAHTHTAALSVQLTKALPAAPEPLPSSSSSSPLPQNPTLHQRILEQAAGSLLATPLPQHEEGCRHRALFLRLLAALAAAHRPRWAGPVLDVLLRDDLLAWVQPAPGKENGALALAWCRAVAAALGGGGGGVGAGGARISKAQGAMATMVAALLARVAPLLPAATASSPGHDDAEEAGERLADALDALLALASTGLREPLEAVLTGALSLLQQQQQQQQQSAAEPLVRLVAALGAVDVWGVVEAALVGPSSSAARQLLFPPPENEKEKEQEQEQDVDAREDRTLAACVALLRAGQGTAADQQPVLDLLLPPPSPPPPPSSSSAAAPDAMEVNGARGPPPALPSPLQSASGWARYRLGREALLHGYFPLAHR
jgi:hypothetical protein